MDDTEVVTVVRNVKDTLFRALFSENKENALSLYNAVNGTHYENAEDLEFTTLSDVVYMGMKNDNSFLFQGFMSLYEHQSTFNPNMPIRGLLYTARLYSSYLKRNDNDKRIYNSTLIRIPTPRYIVFYNGLDRKMKDDTIKLKLSDAFEIEDKSGDYEWTATMVNINADHNKALKESCKILNDYSTFTDILRKNMETMSLVESIDASIDYCIKHDILADFFTRMKAEAKSMILTEFDQQGYEDYLKKENYREGIKDSIIMLLSQYGNNTDSIEEILSNISDERLLSKLLINAANVESLEQFGCILKKITNL